MKDKNPYNGPFLVPVIWILAITNHEKVRDRESRRPLTGCAQLRILRRVANYVISRIADLSWLS